MKYYCKTVTLCDTNNYKRHIKIPPSYANNTTTRRRSINSPGSPGWTSLGFVAFVYEHVCTCSERLWRKGWVMDGQLPSASHPVTVWGEPHDLWRGLSPREAIVSFGCFTPEKIANVFSPPSNSPWRASKGEVLSYFHTLVYVKLSPNLYTFLTSSWQCKIPCFFPVLVREYQRVKVQLKCNSPRIHFW